MFASLDFHGRLFPRNPGTCAIPNGDNPPAAVAEYMAKNNIVKPTSTPIVNLATPKPQTAHKDDGGDLDPGDGGPRVAKLQEELAERGYYKGLVNSHFDQATQDAVVAYKKSKGYGEGPKAGKRVLDDLGIGL